MAERSQPQGPRACQVLFGAALGARRRSCLFRHVPPVPLPPLPVLIMASQCHHQTALLYQPVVPLMKMMVMVKMTQATNQKPAVVPFGLNSGWYQRAPSRPSFPQKPKERRLWGRD